MMVRTAIWKTATTLVALAVMMSLPACSSSNDGASQNNALGSTDAGICPRDLAALNDLLAHPVACVGPSQCPAGSYCDTQRGTCDFECTSDQACGSGSLCSCDGRCEGGNNGSGGSVTCDRNATLLQGAAARSCASNGDCAKGLTCDSTTHACVVGATCAADADCPAGARCSGGKCAAKTCASDADCGGPTCDVNAGTCAVVAPRACEFDDQCPDGSRCDEATHACRYDCSSDANCASGQACDCMGACVTPGTTPTVPGDRAARLTVTPTESPVIEINNTTPWAPARLTASLLAQSSTAAAAAKDADVRVQASAGLLVACGSEHVPANSAFGASCVLNAPWTFIDVGSAQTAAQYVWVKPASAAVLAGEVTFTSDQVSGSPAVASFSSATPSGTQSPPEAAPFAGEYTGTLTLLGTDWFTIDASGTLHFATDQSTASMPATLPVRAWAIDGANGEQILDFFDATRTLADSGKLRASSTRFIYADWLSFIDEFAPPLSENSNGYRAKTVLVIDSFDPVTGTLHGFVIVTPRQGADLIGIQFELTRVGASSACSAGCSASETCATDVGVCEAGDAWFDGTKYDGNFPITFKDTAVDRWASWLRTDGLKTAAVVPGFCSWRPCDATGASFGNGSSGAGRVMCVQAEDSPNTPPDDLDANNVMPVSGDLACTDGHVPHGADLVFDSDRALLDGSMSGTPSLTMLTACMTDLVAQPPLGSVDPAGLFHDALAAHTCMSPAHFYGALRRVAFDATNPLTDPTDKINANKLAHRLLAQWLTIHAFVAKEALQAGGMANAVGAANDLDPQEAAAVTQTPSLTDVMRELERGWDVVLADRELYTLLNGTYLSPDYRAGALGGEQDVGLPVNVLETAALHLDVTTAYLRDAQLATYDECKASGSSADGVEALRTAGRALRYTAHAESAAMWAYERATSHLPVLSTQQRYYLCTGAGNWPNIGFQFPFCGLDLSNVQPATPSWQARFDAARTQYLAARQRAIAAAVGLSTCENPLGVDESRGDGAPPAKVNGIPLYFGDVTGSSSRFFASSDYLVNGWALPAVDRARASLDAARTAWAEKRNSENQQLLTDQDADRRREAISTVYGQQLVDLCGLEGVPASSALGRFTSNSPLRAETCFIKSPADECQRYVDQALGRSPSVPPGQPTPPPPPNPTTPDHCYAGPKEREYRLGMCIANELWSHVYVQEAALHSFVAEYKTAGFSTYASCPSLIASITSAGQTRWATDVTYLTTFAPQRKPAPVELAAADAICRDKLDGETDDPPYVPDAASYASCFRGQLGEQILGTMGARKNVQLALMDWWDAQKLYDIGAKYCDHLKQWKISEATLTEKHNKIMQKLDAARTIAGGLLGFASSVASGDPIGAIGSADLTLQTVAFGDAIADANAEYQSKMQLIQGEQELYACYQEAQKSKLRIDNAATAIEGAIAQADQHTVAFRDLESKAHNLVADGTAALVREQGRNPPTLAFHYWLDERVDRFHKDFAWAKSLTYLSLLAVEYEYQQSLGLRSKILQATNPDQLLDALQTIQQTQISRTIHGRRPEDAHLVRSLVSDVLGLDDQHPTRAGERHWSKLERFQHRLWSPQYAIYDDHGVYLGQGIPFSLVPDGELTYACAEKLWQVTATVQGDGLSALAPSASVMLLKRNQFASQWCSGQGDGSSMQTASVQPPSALFHPDDRGGTEAAVRQYVTARIAPWFNVPRSDFYRDAYAEGASQELAGRGLYGDYVLLFPAEGLLRDGFPLGKVEDVLLRFDYLSVDNLSVSNRTAPDEDGQ